MTPADRCVRENEVRPPWAMSRPPCAVRTGPGWTGERDPGNTNRLACWMVRFRPAWTEGRRLSVADMDICVCRWSLRSGLSGLVLCSLQSRLCFGRRSCVRSMASNSLHPQLFVTPVRVTNLFGILSSCPQSRSTTGPQSVDGAAPAEHRTAPVPLTTNGSTEESP